MTFIAYLIPAIVIGASAYFSIRSFKKTGNAAQAVRLNLMIAAVLFVGCAVSPFVARFRKRRGRGRRGRSPH